MQLGSSCLKNGEHSEGRRNRSPPHLCFRWAEISVPALLGMVSLCWRRLCPVLRCVSWKTRESRALHWTFLRVLWPNLFPLRRVRSLSFRRHGFLFGSRIWLSATGLMVLSSILSVNTVACFESGDGGERWHHVLWPSRLLVSVASAGSLRGICWHFQPT